MIKRWLRQFFSLDRREPNVVYFLIFFLLVLTMALSHFYIWDVPLFGVPLFFLIHAMGQALLESGLFFLAALILHRWAPQWIFHAFIGFSFAILLIHFVDFTIIRLMDTSISYLYKYFFGSGWLHLLTAFQALNVNWSFIFLCAALLIFLPLTGIALYRITLPIAKLMAWKIPFIHLSLALFALSAGLYSLDLLFHPNMTRIVYSKYKKALPLGTTFLEPVRHSIPLSAPIAPFRDEEAIQKKLAQIELKASAKPNIYLFVVETFRKDFATAEIAPNLTRFGNENISFHQSFSNANSTHASWFAIFHSDFPYHWTGMRDTWKEGSVPLQALKKMGYKTRIYSSADLAYFNMDQLLFGEGRKQIDQIEEFSQNRLIEPCERDALCFQSFFRDIEKPEAREGNLFVFFLDSTHSEYSVPKDYPIPFKPIVTEIDYLTLTPKELEPVKNRYRNAIHYVDSLMGQFFARLKETELYDQAIIAIAGDHGEEFFEEGALFHGTHLNKYQTSVPIYYKFQNNRSISPEIIATHLDIFPSILHYLTEETQLESLYDGQSLFLSERWPYRIAVSHNGAETPCEFSIENGPSRLLFRFMNPLDIYSPTNLEALLPVDESSIALSDALAPLQQTKN